MADEDNYSTTGPTCPHCGHVSHSSDNPECHDESLCEWECGDCGKVYRLSVYVQWSWTSSPKIGGA